MCFGFKGLRIMFVARSCRHNNNNVSGRIKDAELLKKHSEPWSQLWKNPYCTEGNLRWKTLVTKSFSTTLKSSAQTIVSFRRVLLPCIQFHLTESWVLTSAKSSDTKACWVETQAVLQTIPTLVFIPILIGFGVSRLIFPRTVGCQPWTKGYGVRTWRVGGL
jgi:hypothetical protein